MKKKMLAIASLLIYAAILVSGSLAYFTADDQAVNVFTIGSVDIEIYEYADLGKEDEIKDGQMPESFYYVEPGKRIVKLVEIKNEGNNPAWVRAKIVDSITAAPERGGGKLSPGILKYNINNLYTETNQEDWNEENGWHYYPEILEPGESVILFDVVTFDGPTMDNSYQGCTTNIQVYAQAVQSEGGTDPYDSTIWPAEERVNHAAASEEGGGQS